MIEAETCSHLVTLSKINIHNTSYVLTCESLLLTWLQHNYVTHVWVGIKLNAHDFQFHRSWCSVAVVVLQRNSRRSFSPISGTRLLSCYQNFAGICFHLHIWIKDDSGRSLRNAGCNIHHLKTKRRPLSLKTQSIPRSKHFPSRLQKPISLCCKWHKSLFVLK